MDDVDFTLNDMLINIVEEDIVKAERVSRVFVTLHFFNSQGNE